MQKQPRPLTWVQPDASRRKTSNRVNRRRKNLHRQNPLHPSARSSRNRLRSPLQNRRKHRHRKRSKRLRKQRKKHRLRKRNRRSRKNRLPKKRPRLPNRHRRRSRLPKSRCTMTAVRSSRSSEKRATKTSSRQQDRRSPAAMRAADRNPPAVRNRPVRREDVPRTALQAARVRQAVAARTLLPPKATTRERKRTTTETTTGTASSTVRAVPIIPSRLKRKPRKSTSSSGRNPNRRSKRKFCPSAPRWSTFRSRSQDSANRSASPWRASS